MAEKLEEKANNEINRPRQANTSRRASMAANATERAYKQLALAKTVRNIAIRIMDGELKHLGQMSQVTQLETLLSIQNRAIPRNLFESDYDGYSMNYQLKPGTTIDDYIANAVLPELTIDQNMAEGFSRDLKGKKGYMRLAAELLRLPKAKGEYRYVSEDQLVKINAAVKAGHISQYSLGFLPDSQQSLGRLKRLGITTDEQLRSAIRELDSLRVEKQKEDPLKKLERDLIGKKIEGYFPTPKELVEQMLDYADIQPGHRVLEPSAGKGNIAQEIKAAAPNALLDVVEYDAGLRAILEAKGFKVAGSNFMEFKGEYDRIVMNPPFEKFQDIDHVKHAFSLLRPGGKLVSIMGAGVKNSRSKAVAFRQWIDDAGSYIEDLPDGSFKSADRTTGVSTVMVVLEKNDTNTLNAKAEVPAVKPEKKQVTHSELEGQLIKEFPGVKLSLTRTEDIVTVSKIIIPKEQQRKGTGSKIMQKLVDWADENEVLLAATPTSDFGGKVKGIREFNQKFGFVDNKGRGKIFETQESMYREPQASNKIFHAPGRNHRGSFKSIGLPERPDNEIVSIGNKTVKLPSEDDPIRREGIQVRIESIIGPRIYNSKIKGKSIQGLYRPENSEIRTREFYDVEVLAHEVGHYLDIHYKFKNRFNTAYKRVMYRDEVESLSYTNEKNLVGHEGFAEFVRLWLTQYTAASELAPKFTEKFESELKRDFTLNSKMKRLQSDMHKWFNQGDMARLNAVTSGNQYSSKEKFTRLTMKRPAELLRQQYIDHIHAAKVMTRETKGKLSDATVDAYKQLQLINGISGIFEESVKNGAPKFKENGDISFIGPSIEDIWGASIKHSAKQLRAQEMYFVVRRGKELKPQGRENMLTWGMINKGLALGEKYPSFKKSFSDYQEYTKNMMNFYVDSGYLERAAAEKMLSKNKEYVPFHRVTEGIIEYNKGEGANFQALVGGTQNIKHVYSNIIMQDSKHIQAALKAKALRDLYSETLKSQEGSKFITKIQTDSEAVNTNIDQMTKKISKVMYELGVDISEGENIDTEAKIKDYFKENQEELMFWNFGVKPKTVETMVDSFIDKESGKRVWVEINKDNKILPDMLDSLDGFTLPSGIAGVALKSAMGVKQLQTLFITSMMQFAGPNIVRDQQQALFLSGGKFRPVIDTGIGLTHYLGGIIKKNSLVSEMKAQGGPGGGRVKTFLENEWGFVDKKDYRFRKPFYHPTQISKDLLDIYVSIMDSFEMSTRIGFYVRLKKDGYSARESAFRSREISTDFHKHGSYAPFVLLQRTVPFFGAYVQSVDLDLRAIAEKNGEIKLGNLVKTESGRASFNDLKVKMLAIGGLYLAIHLSLALLGDDDDRYKALTPDQKARFYHYFIGGSHYTIPKPHGLISFMGSITEGLTDFYNGQKLDSIKKDIAFALAYHFGADAMPGILNPVAEVTLNKTFTGAPIVSKYKEARSEIYQYSGRTPEIYIGAGKKLGVSPAKIQHMVRGYTGYIEEIIAETTEEYLWDQEAWGDRPNKRTAKEMIGKQFVPKEVPYRTKYTTGYYDLRERYKTAKADLSFAIKSAAKDKTIISEVVSNDLNNTFIGMGKLFSEADEVLSSQQDILNYYAYNKSLSGKEKTKKIESWYRQKNELLYKVYNIIRDEIEAAEKKLESLKK
jgi:phospholipid N-methyltransferase